MFFATQEAMRMRSQRESDKPQNKFLWEVLPDGSWKGNPCVVIGGGPSLEEFDWNLLNGRLTIGVFTNGMTLISSTQWIRGFSSGL